MSDSVDDMAVGSREAFGKFLGLLRQDLLTAPDSWENTSLVDFLDAMQAYAGDIQEIYDGAGQSINADKPSWQTFADILRGASIYE